MSRKGTHIFNMRFLSRSTDQTMRLGKAIARHALPGDIICLSGDLGSGKTVLAKGIAQGLGIDKSEVISPTFVLLRQYEGRLPLFHFDFYRLQTAADIAGLGYEEFLYGNGVSVIEWPGRMRTLLPRQHLLVELSVRGQLQRLMRLRAFGARYEKLIKDIDEDTRG